MAAQIVLPEGYHYVVAGIVSTVWLLLWQVDKVTQHCKKFGIKYPQLYAEKAEAEASHEAHVFNCAQRAHQNTLEYMPIVLITTLVLGIKYPIFAASACALWAFTRVLYTFGYIMVPSELDGQHRDRGVFEEISLTGLVFGSAYVVYRLLADA